MSAQYSNSSGISASVPANLLLVGEYAVTCEGGLGVALAVDHRARGSWTPGGPTRIEGFTTTNGPPTFVWPGDEALLNSCSTQLNEQCGDPGGTFRLDTTAFFHPDGSKRGFGSSAAMVTLLTALWHHAVGVRMDALMYDSICVHRVAQGGHGSGYDVATSVTGGVVRFTGGTKPGAEPIELPWLPRLALFRGKAPVATTGAVARFRNWAGDHPGELRTHLDRSNQLIEAFLACGNWDEGLTVLDQYRELAVDLGRKIGVPAEIDPPGGLAPALSWWKALGAGDEIGIGVLRGNGQLREHAELQPVELSREGLQWE